MNSEEYIAIPGFTRRHRPNWASLVDTTHILQVTSASSFSSLNSTDHAKQKRRQKDDRHFRCSKSHVRTSARCDGMMCWAGRHRAPDSPSVTPHPESVSHPSARSTRASDEFPMGAGMRATGRIKTLFVSLARQRAQDPQ